MGKSRLLDEFAKEHFVIPVNLRESGTRGESRTFFLQLWSVIFVI
jgi:hypothetical protein